MAKTEPKATAGMRPARRTIVKGAAWAVPVVAVASAAPAMAASEECLQLSHGGAACKLPGSGNNFTFRLQYCFTNNCATGTVTVNIVKLRAKNGSYEVAHPETILVPPGETVCMAAVVEVSGSNSGNWQQVYFTVGSGTEVHFAEFPAPPDCPPAAGSVPATEEPAVEAPVTEEPAVEAPVTEEPPLEEPTVDTAEVPSAPDTASTDEATDNN